MQPNYAFSDTHHGSVHRNRLAVTAELARTHGMGVEMEAGKILSNAGDRRAFLQYLADGAPARLGYQAAAMAYFLDTDTVQRLVASTDPSIRATYDALADYVSGKVVPDPDPSIQWNTTPAGQLSSDGGSLGAVTLLQSALHTCTRILAVGPRNLITRSRWD